MRLKHVSTGVALAALMAVTGISQSVAQTAPAPAEAQAQRLDPAAEQAPQRAPRATPEFRMADGIIATVNDRIITGFDLRQRMLVIIAMSQVQPTQEDLPAIQQQALNDLIDHHLQLAELEKYPQALPSEEEINAEIAATAREAGTTPQNFLAFLAQGGIRPETYREQLRVETGWRTLVGGRFNDRSRVSRGQVDQAMRQLADAATKTQYLVSEIFIDASRVGGMQEALNGSRQLFQQMVQGAPFMNVARQFSSASSAARGGDAGWLVEGTINPALEQALSRMEPGQLAPPIAVEGGVYIVYLRDKRSGSATSLVKMKQVMVQVPENASQDAVAAATAKLESFRATGLTCDNIIEKARGVDGLMGADLGESDVSDLLPQFQQVARSSDVGSISSVVRTPVGVHLLAVCDRRLGGPQAPSRQQVENRLREQNYAMLGRRYIRDLRNDALIEIKQ